MDYIDWIIATIVFLVTVSLILVTVFDFIPVSKETNIVSENLYKNIVENIEVYNIKTTDTEITPYMFNPKENSGISQNISLIEEGKYYGVLKEKDTFFILSENQSDNWNKPPTEIMLEENQELLLDIYQIETPVLWLDASTLNLNNGDLVEIWPDKSGNNKDAEIYSDSNAPIFKTNAINGKPALKFTGENNQKLKTPPLDLTDEKYSIISVFKNEKKTSTSGLWSFFDTLQGFIFVNGDGRWIGSSSSSSFIYCNNSNRDEFIINSVIKSGGLNIADNDFELNMYINTKNETGNNPSPGNSFATSNGKEFRIGAWASLVPPDIIFGGEFSEIIVFNKILEEDERLFVENYLSQKYNILVNNGINFSDDNIKIYNKNTNELITTLYFVNENTNDPVSCEYNYKNKKISIESCDDENAIIVSDYDFDNINFGSIPKESPLGILVLEERFDDFDYQNNFEITPEANINTGVLLLEADTIIKTKNKYYDYSGFLSTTDATTVFFNEDINNTFFCEFSNYAIISGKMVGGTKYILKTEDYNKSLNWNKIEFRQDPTNHFVYCKIGNIVVEQSLGENLTNSKITIKTENDNTLIDDFYVYLNNDMVSNPVTKNIKGNYIDCNLNNNIANIKLIKEEENKSLDFVFSKNLVNPDNTGITIVKTDAEENKISFFPQTKEFWIFKDKDENIEVTFDETLNILSSEIEPENTYLWLDASSLELNDNDSVELWEDKSGNDFHAIQSENNQKPTFKTNILNGNPVIRFNNSHYLLLPNSTSSNLDGQSGVTVFLVANKTKHDQKNTFWDITVSGTGYSKILLDFLENNKFRSVGRSMYPEAYQVITTIEEYIDDNYYLFSTTQNLLSNYITIWTNGKETGNGIVSFGSQVYLGTGSSHTIGSAANFSKFLQGDIAEIILYDYVLPDENRIEIEKYLGKKYNLNLEIKKNGKKIELFDNAVEKNKIILEFFDKETGKQINCNYIFDDTSNKINIIDCEKDAIIKVRFDLEGVDEFPKRSKINITKTKEEIITENKFIKLKSETEYKKDNEERIYYLRLFNKVTNLENTENMFSTKPYTNFTKFLWNNGFLEKVNVEIKNN